MEEATLVSPVPADGIDALESHVQNQLAGRVREFRLSFRGKGLVLRGQAPTYHAKQIAQHAVMKATELPIVANEIEVA